MVYKQNPRQLFMTASLEVGTFLGTDGILNYFLTGCLFLFGQI